MLSPDELTVREATLSDLNGVVALGLTVQTLHVEHLPELFSEPDVEALREFFGTRLGDDALLLVAARGAELVGYLYAEHLTRDAGPFLRASSLLYIHHIAVDPQVQGQRIGTTLMKSAVDVAARLGVSGIRLDSWSFNVEAHQFFAAQGFSPIRTVFERSLTAQDEKSSARRPRGNHSSRA